MQEGPSSKTTYHCNDCVHLKTKDWEFYGENDEVDLGANAKCLKENKHISCYWSKSDQTPEWCPYLK